jgi:hypothetical protein
VCTSRDCADIPMNTWSSRPGVVVDLSLQRTEVCREPFFGDIESRAGRWCHLWADPVACRSSATRLLRFIGLRRSGGDPQESLKKSLGSLGNPNSLSFCDLL